MLTLYVSFARSIGPMYYMYTVCWLFEIWNYSFKCLDGKFHPSLFGSFTISKVVMK